MHAIDATDPPCTPVALTLDSSLLTSGDGDCSQDAHAPGPPMAPRTPAVHATPPPGTPPCTPAVHPSNAPGPPAPLEPDPLCPKHDCLVVMWICDWEINQSTCQCLVSQANAELAAHMTRTVMPAVQLVASLIMTSA